MSKILVVEDEKPIADGIIFNLRRKDHEVDHAEDGRTALEMVENKPYDLIILDIRLPEVDGFEVCQSLRRKKNFTPILMLTARDQRDDIVHGLKSGADDYLTKPFDLTELLARVEGLLRRQQWSAGASETTSGRWEFGKSWIDFESWEALTNQGIVVLSKKEVDVMRLFRAKPGQVVSRKELLEKVWGLPQHPNTRIVDNVIVSLRKYFEEDSQNPKHIINMRGAGYKFIP